MKYQKNVAALWLVAFYVGSGSQDANAQPSTTKVKCTLSDGLVVYSARACPVAGTVGEDMARKEHAFEKRKQEQESAAQQRNAQDAARLKLCGGKPVVEKPEVGMTESHFLNCTVLGIYKVWNQINETETTSGIHRQYVVDRPNVKYVYTRNGMVTTVQR